VTIKVPKFTFVEEREHWVDMEKVLLDKFVKQCPRRHTKASLEFKEVHILGRNVG
jgi:hypothetical protein